jgi:hypothetical protein
MCRRFCYNRGMKLRIYIDTSVLGGCEDLQFQEYSRQLMAHFVTGHFTLVLSDLTVQELAAAPEEVRARLAEVPEAHIEVLQLDSEAMDLADAYISEGVISAKLRADA